MQLFAPDTNFFLQCLPPGQIAWSELTDDQDIVLLLVREVRKELDKHKSAGNQRRARRARAASTLLRELTVSGAGELELRPSNPRVRLRSAGRADATDYPRGYRVESADERIIAEAYAARRELGAEGLTFLSHDMVPLEDAVQVGLPVAVIPDSWLLPPEPSDADRALDELKRRLSRLEGREPIIEITAPVDDDGKLRLRIPSYPPLDEEFIALAMRHVRLEHPPTPAMDPSLARMLGQQVPESIWERYLTQHSAWLVQVESRLRLLHGALYAANPFISCALSLANTGASGADNLIIRFQARGAFGFSDPGAMEVEDETREFLGQPPKRPEASSLMADFYPLVGRTDPIDRLSRRLAHITPRPARDRHTIYWNYDEDRMAKVMEGQCQDYRHGLAPTAIELLIEVDLAGRNNGAIDVLVSAGNLVEPKKRTIPVVFEPMSRDTKAFAIQFLEAELDVQLP